MFTLLYSNVRSLQNKIAELNTLLGTLDPSIILLDETWLSLQTPTGFLDFKGYMIYRKDRDTRGGGLLIAVKDYITHHLT